MSYAVHNVRRNAVLNFAMLDTPLGQMTAVADHESLYLLEFSEPKRLEYALDRIRKRARMDITRGNTPITALIEKELALYFAGQLTKFATPLSVLGSDFQKTVWADLQKIPFSETRSYAELARNLDKPTAFRAAANANGANHIAIVIPCHRVINSNGNLGGYGGGVPKKKWLLEHEKRFSISSQL